MKVVSAYVIRSDGELAYSRVLSDGGKKLGLSLPNSVTAGVTLLSSSASADKQRTYFLEDGDNLWAYAIFSEFAIVALTRQSNHKAQLKQRLVSLGKAIRKSYGDILDMWAGEIPQMEELNSLVDRYLVVKPTASHEKVVASSRKVLDEALEDYDVAYIGIFDAEGKMVYGNVPESHALRIQEEINNSGFKPNPDMVPTSLNVHKYDVQFFKVGSFSIVSAPYKGGSRMEAVHAVDDIMQALKDVGKS